MKTSMRIGTFFYFFCLCWCLLSFKILLGGLQEAGIRIDDILIALVFLILLARGRLFSIPRSHQLNAYLVFILVSLFSSFWNGYLGRVPTLYSIIFDARLTEYLVFYYIGYILASRKAPITPLIKFYFYLLCVVVPLQMLHFLPTPSSFAASRASGNTNGPYELAIVAAFLFYYLGYRENMRFSLAGSFVLLTLTASRITSASVVVQAVLRFITRIRSQIKRILVSVAIGMTILVAVLWILNGSTRDPNSLASRLKSSKSLLSGDYADLYNEVPVYSTSVDYMHGAFAGAIEAADISGSDVSGMIRLFRWATLIKSTLMHPDSIIIGLGPSFGTAAVDGYYVRVFIETGLIGLSVFIIFLRTLLTTKIDRAHAFREFCITMIITACFIDIFTSYKAMLLLWLWNGMCEYDRRSAIECA